MKYVTWNEFAAAWNAARRPSGRADKRRQRRIARRYMPA
jgi:hypothetical protein